MRRISITLVGVALAAASALARPDDTVKIGATAPQTKGTGRPGDGNAPIATDATGSPPANAAATQAVLGDVSNAYAGMEKNIELQFGKLTQQTKGNIEALEDKIKSLESQIEKLKQEAKKIELIAQKIEELLPKIMAAFGTDPGGALKRTPSAAKGADLKAFLAAELTRAGVSMSQEFPKLLLADMSTAASLPGGTAVAFLSSRFGEQAAQKIAETNKTIDTLQAQLKALKEQLAALEKQVAKLEQDKQKALGETRKQKEKALAEAAKARDARLVRISTPTPTPKRP
jgi:polyhydroxyalkanoate synthesis regulator phasin